MADIIMGNPQGDQGSGGFMNWLLPLIGIGVLGFIAYILLSNTSNNNGSGSYQAGSSTTPTSPITGQAGGGSTSGIVSGSGGSQGAGNSGSLSNLCALLGIGCPTCTGAGCSTPAAKSVASNGNPTVVPAPNYVENPAAKTITVTDYSSGMAQTQTLPMPFVSSPVVAPAAPAAPAAAASNVVVQALAGIGSVAENVTQNSMNTIGAVSQQAESAIGGGIGFLQGLL